MRQLQASPRFPWIGMRSDSLPGPLLGPIEHIIGPRLGDLEVPDRVFAMGIFIIAVSRSRL